MSDTNRHSEHKKNFPESSIFQENDPEVLKAVIDELNSKIDALNAQLDDPNFVEDPYNSLEKQTDALVYQALQRIVKPEYQVDPEYPERPLVAPRLPPTVDWLTHKAQTRAIELCETLVEYYNTPIIWDRHAQEHKKRRQEREEIFDTLGAVFRSFIDKSKIRGNTNFAIYGLLYGMSTQIHNMRDPDTRAIELKAAIDELHKKFCINGLELYSYPTWPAEDKIAMTTTINPSIEVFIDEVKRIYGL